jgi:UDP-N-acetylmuramoylalanine--D-glutamate ligase
VSIPRTCNADLVPFGRKNGHVVRILKENIVLSVKGREEVYYPGRSALGDATGMYNCCPAIMTARIMGCTQEQIQRGLEKFSPLEHRMEFVEELDGISFFNDSKATNTGAVLAALEGMKERRTILILGGRDKGDDYSLLKGAVAEKVKAAVLIGEAAVLIEEALKGTTVIARAVSLENAVKKACEYAVEGDTVLLSPACASFDMFDSYSHRGRVFREAVLACKEGRRSG